MKIFIMKQPGYVLYRNERGEYHREDGPALEYSNGSYFWYKNDALHREDGPAAYSIGYGEKQYWLNGQLIDPKTFANRKHGHHE